MKKNWWSNDETIIELGYHKISWFVSVSQIYYLFWLWQITDLLTTDKSWYFAQPHPIMVTLFCFRRNNSKSSFGRSWKWEGCSICKCATITQFICKGSKKSNSWGKEIVVYYWLDWSMFPFYNIHLPDEPKSQSDLTQKVAMQGDHFPHMYLKIN